MVESSVEDTFYKKGQRENELRLSDGRFFREAVVGR